MKIIPIQPQIEDQPVVTGEAAGSSNRNSDQARRTFGRNLPSRRTFGYRGPSRRSF